MGRRIQRISNTKDLYEGSTKARVRVRVRTRVRVRVSVRARVRVRGSHQG